MGAAIGGRGDARSVGAVGLRRSRASSRRILDRWDAWPLALMTADTPTPTLRF